MPDGLGSIADIKIMVDAETEKFGKGIADARELIKKFGGEGNEHLGKIDSMLGKVGSSAELVRKTFEDFGGSLTKSLASLNPYLAMLEKAAAITGAKKEFDDLKAAVGDLSTTLATAAPEALNAAVEAMKGYVVGTRDAAAATAAAEPTFVRLIKALPAAVETAEAATAKAVEGTKEALEALPEPVRQVASEVSTAAATAREGFEDIPQALAEAGDAAREAGEGLKAASADVADAAEEAAEGGRKALEVIKETEAEVSAAADEAVREATKDQVKLIHQAVLDSATVQVRATIANLMQMTKGIGTLTGEQIDLQIADYERRMSTAQRLFDEFTALRLQSEMQGGFKLFYGDGPDPVKLRAELEALGATLVELKKRRDDLNKKQDDEQDAERANLTKYIEAMERQLEQLKLQAEVRSMGKAEAAEHLAIRKAELEAERQGLEIGEDTLAQIKEKAAALREATQELENFGKALKLVEAEERFDEALARSTDQLRNQVATLGMSKAAAAEYLFVKGKLAEAERAGVEVDEDRLADIQKEAAARGRLTAQVDAHAAALKREADAKRDLDAQHRGIDRLNATMDRELEQMEARGRLMRMAREDAIALSFAEKTLVQARRDHIDLTPADIAGINETARAYAALQMQVEAMERAQKSLQETSSVVSNGILREFESWTRGGEFNVKRMVSNMLAEFAKLALQRNVLDWLFGGGSSGNKSGGVFGDFLSSAFDFRADGGPIDAGRPTIVGERGPELLLPQRDGFVVPNHQLSQIGGSMFAPSINLSIDARGATDGAIAELQRLKAELPGMIIGTMSDARERGLA